MTRSATLARSSGGPALAVLAVVAGALLGGCGKNCQNTCARIYDSNECGISIAGVEATTSRRECVLACEGALANAGEMGGYDPYVHQNPSDPPELENERQAAAWMECVWSMECADLDPVTGFCAPIVF